MTSFLAALSFLTIFPARLRADVTQQAISNSRAWFPLVGLLLGLVLVGLEWALAFVFPLYLTAAFLVVFLIVITRAFHLDGLMDTCDGLLGGDTPERRREIMRDSHVGAFAVAGGAGVILLKYAAVVALLSLDMPGKEWALLLFPAFSRYAMVLQLMTFRYVRAPGLGSPFHGHDARVMSIVATVLSVLAALLLGGIGGVLVLAAVCLLTLLLGQGMVALAGGMTGDTYGATNELMEVVALVAAVLLVPFGILGPMTWLITPYL